MRYRQPQSGRIKLDALNPLTKGLIGAWSYYSADGTSAIDLSGNNSAGVGTITGNPTLVTTTRGNALSFNGSTQYIHFGTPTQTVSGKYTVLAWVNPSSFAETGCIFSTREGNDGSIDFKIPSGGTTIHGDIGYGSSWINTAADATYTFAINTWYQIAYVVTTAGYTIYINGAQVGSGSFSNTPLLWDSLHTLNIGRVGSGIGDEYFNGLIGEVLVYNRALIASDVLSLYNNPWQLLADNKLILKPATGGAPFIASPPNIVRQAVKRASYY
jgi:hypothetical protein